MTTDLSARAGRACYFVRNIVDPGLDTGIFSESLVIWASSVGNIMREKYIKNLRSAHDVWEVPLDMVISTVMEKHNCVIVTSRSKGVLRTGDVYENEYLFIIDFDVADQIASIREYFDHERVERVYRPAIAKLSRSGHGV